MKRVKGRYEVDGIALPSVTTILGTLGKPALLGWYAKIAAEEGDASAPRRRGKEAADRGSAVHQIILAHLSGGPRLDSLPDIVPYVEQWDAFAACHKLEPIILERPVFHAGERYAGQCDAGLVLTCRDCACEEKIDGGQIVLDFKTIDDAAKLANAPWSEQRLQVEAYRRAEKYEDADGKIDSMIGTIGAAVLRLAPGAWKLDQWLDEEEQERTFAAFLAARDLYEWSRQYERSEKAPY